MKNFYDPKNLFPDTFEEEEDIWIPKEKVLDFKKDELFHIGQSYGHESGKADTAHCKNCGGKEFNVGIGDYYTAVRCVACEFEICVHEG